MKLPFFAPPLEFAIERLSTDDADHLPNIHAEHFLRPWSEDEFSSLLDQTPEAAAPDTYSYSGPRDIALYHESFVRIKSGQNLYSVDPDGVRIIADRLFRAELTLPSGLPFGTYITEFFLFEKGRVVGYQTGELSVAITGLEQWLRVTAHDMPLLYGLFGVFIAGFMGWGVATLFRRV